MVFIFDPAIGNVLIIILIQEHLAAERFDTEITTLITGPKGKNPYSKAEEERTDRFHLPEDVHIHERQHGYVLDNFWHVYTFPRHCHKDRHSGKAHR